MDTGTCCWVYYNSNQVTSKCCHVKENSQFVRARNPNYDARFEIEGDHRRKTAYPAGYRSPPLQSRKAPPKICNGNVHNKERNPQ